MKATLDGKKGRRRFQSLQLDVSSRSSPPAHVSTEIYKLLHSAPGLVTAAESEAMYRAFAKHYDTIYSYKKTGKEVRFIRAVMRKHRIRGKEVLDVACGTGRHAELLADNGYGVLGIDKHEQMLRIARGKAPTAKFVRGDMRTFRSRRRFDAVICMFTSLCYNTSKADLIKTLRNLGRHTKEGGIVVFDVPLVRLKGEHDPQGDVIDRDAAVLYLWREKGRLTIGDLYWIVKGPGKGAHGKGSVVVSDRHVLRMYSLAEMKEAIEEAGLKGRAYWDFSTSRRKGWRPVFVCCRE